MTTTYIFQPRNGGLFGQTGRIHPLPVALEIRPKRADARFAVISRDAWGDPDLISTHASEDLAERAAARSARRATIVALLRAGEDDFGLGGAREVESS